MDDLTPDLLAAIQKDWDSLIEKDPAIKKLLEDLESPKTTYRQAHQYAIRLGEHLVKAIGGNVTPGSMPDETMYFNIAMKVLTPLLTDVHERVSDFCKVIQQGMNESAGLGLKAVKPDLNTDRIKGICDAVSSGTLEEKAWALQEPIVNFSQNVVDSYVKTNADFHYSAGLRPKIIRIAVSHCCDWCQKKAGTYDYGPDLDRDVFRRHENCRCITDCKTDDGKLQDVWSKRWHTDQDLVAARKQREAEAQEAERQRAEARRQKQAEREAKKKRS